MELDKAIDQISQIHEQLAKAEVYRGWRSAPMVISGLCGMAGAALQPAIIGKPTPMAFTWYWFVLGALCGSVAVSVAFYNYLVGKDIFHRRSTPVVFAQTAPAMLAGIMVTMAMASTDGQFVPLLPGIWVLLLSLATFSARPYMPRATGWVALYYFVTATWLLLTARAPGNLSGWRVGGICGLGQFATAAVLYWNLERRPQ